MAAGGGGGGQLHKAAVKKMKIAERTLSLGGISRLTRLKQGRNGRNPGRNPGRNSGRNQGKRPRQEPKLEPRQEAQAGTPGTPGWR